jgi:hypothetical protein
VKIVDFGIARLVTGVRETEDRSISGTPEYMAPEVISGAPPSFASDIYAVGIILYELLAEKTPFFASSTTEILTNHLKAQPTVLTSRRAGVPRELDSVIGRALAKHPSDRYSSAARVAARDSRAHACIARDRQVRIVWRVRYARVQVLSRVRRAAHARVEDVRGSAGPRADRRAAAAIHRPHRRAPGAARAHASQSGLERRPVARR